MYATTATFMDLKKAHHSTDWEAMWEVLNMYRVSGKVTRWKDKILHMLQHVIEGNMRVKHLEYIME